MNPDNGRLVALRRGDLMPAGHEELPRELYADARAKLMRAMTAEPPAEAQVNIRSSTPLAQWAKKKRLAKIAAKSRRRNRNGQR